MDTEVRADLSRAPYWATHYVQRKDTEPEEDVWWFVNIKTREWTVYCSYRKKFHTPWEDEWLREDTFYWLELNPALENK